ncbi:MAG: hypothetical protein IKJ41_09545 [Clostridia bacterium]|nr:hypothetical protein [Clostridia bacterium]
MKGLFKKSFSFFLALMITVSAIVTNASAIEADEFFDGATVEFGSYPQSKVTDETVLSDLNSLELTWTYYDYYAGTSTQYPTQSVIGSMKQLDFMKYCDVELNGEKYRAVYMEKYRPNNTTLTPIADNSLIDAYGYSLKTVYWFRYEPIIWTVLDAENGIMMTTDSIDAQPFNNNQYSKNNLIYSDQYTDFADDYNTSSIRDWLNNDFFSIAFSSEDTDSMLKTDVVTDSETTNDYVYLLSAEETVNPDYGFSADTTERDVARRADSTDYAISQGLIIQANGTNWFTRSTGNSAFGHGAVTGVNHSGNLNTNFSVSACTLGIRPVIKINPEKLEKPYVCPECGKEFFGEDATNEHIAYESSLKVKIKIYNNKRNQTVDCGEKLKLAAVTTNKPAGSKIYWYVNGVKKGEGTTFELSASSDVTVTVKLVDSNGTPYRTVSGKELSDSEKINVKSGFFQRIIAFFRDLFKIERIILQGLN